MSDAEAGYAQHNDVSPPSNSANDKIYEPKHQKKVIRVLTVFAYVFFVSLAAIMLSAYYIILWKPIIPKRDRLTPDRLVQAASTTGPWAQGLIQEDYSIHSRTERFRGVADTLLRDGDVVHGRPPTVFPVHLPTGVPNSDVFSGPLLREPTTPPLPEGVVQREPYTPEMLLQGEWYNLHVTELVDEEASISIRNDLLRGYTTTPPGEVMNFPDFLRDQGDFAAKAVQMREGKLVSVLDQFQGDPYPVTKVMKEKKFDYVTDLVEQTVTPNIARLQPRGQGHD